MAGNVSKATIGLGRLERHGSVTLRRSSQVLCSPEQGPPELIHVPVSRSRLPRGSLVRAGVWGKLPRVTRVGEDRPVRVAHSWD